jgi:hypothetical protein
MNFCIFCYQHLFCKNEFWGHIIRFGKILKCTRYFAHLHSNIFKLQEVKTFFAHNNIYHSV